jgi:ATP-binding cassette subfamily B protein
MIAFGDPFLTVGRLIAFNGVLMTLVFPTTTISFAIGMVAGGIAAARRIYTMEQREVAEEVGDTEYLPWPERIEGRVEFKDVSFAYDRKSSPVLRRISFIVEPGETCAIVGPTGSGKSTLTKLLLRLYPLTRGTIKIDGVDILEYRLEDLRRRIGLIEQDVFLFSTSIRNNIAFGKPSASMEEIVNMARMAQADEFIRELPEEYESVIGERGVTLSGGQKQRIAIARAFLTSPRILILDDSTSAIDSATEEKIVTAIHALLKNRTTFVITHRLSTIRSSDKVIVLKRGRIVAMGHHNDLIQVSEDYRRIFGKRMDLPPLQSPEGMAGAYVVS